MSANRARLLFAVALIAAPVLVGVSSALDATAEAQCVQNGTTVTCTGSVGTVSYNAPSVTILNVNSLTATAAWVSLTGTGSAPGSGGDSHFTCTPNPSDCTITIGVNTADTCSVKSGAPSGTQCVSTGAAAFGPAGTSGPNVTVTVQAGNFFVTPGGGTATVVGRSQGSNGGNGGNAYVVGDAGDGGSGANGGNVTVSLTGSVAPAAGQSGLVAASVAGNGGNGGNAYVVSGSAGNGGQAGFGGDANARFLGGSIVTTDAAGIGAFSQGGNGGSGGGGGGLVFTPGSGSGAGQAGAAQVFTAANTSILTFGSYSYGILAQSLGGGGGSGSGGFGLFYSGGSGGSTGGAGGLVSVEAHGWIMTVGDFSHGILAQSIGGGGGDAGSSSGLVALGGDGGGGGEGRQVLVVNTGSITTFGLGSNAIEAQSIGGGGGNGSTSKGAFALGGNGAGTTTGGTVTVSNAGLLMTSGARSTGILAQSIGGGGGDGGSSGGIFAWGGSGGSGANGGLVTVFNSGNIQTGLFGLQSFNSHGILAQSIGGGGGNGGGAIAVDVSGTGISAAFGGSGGSGGTGGHVQVLLDDPDSSLATGYSIETFGNVSNAVMAQSIGGGGGSGGFAVSVSYVVALGVAGNGGPGGAAGQVDVTAKGLLTTHGDNSIGLLAQSIGGGGGNGGFALAGGLTASVSVGGAGGLGGAASDVNVTSLSNVSTFGVNSHGILAQSIGGGGGNGGFAGSASLAISVGLGGSGGSGGSSGQVTVNSTGTISTNGENSLGVAAQSLGGGGGNGGFAAAIGVGVGTVSVGVGGSGGTGGSSAGVFLVQDGAVSTSGHNAPGILGQSVGGGGGNGGFAFTLAGGAALGVAVGVGGTGGGGSQAGAVSVTSMGAGVFTVGEHSPGIRAQSIGGGGGNGGFSLSIAASATVYGVGGAAAVSVGGKGGHAGNASTVLVNSTGLIFTQGHYSNGIEAQSIGGGGGNGGFAIAGAFTLGQVAAGVAVGGGGNGGGLADIVTVVSAGMPSIQGVQSSPEFGTTTLQTSGTQANGILAQSLGGGGGNGGFAGSLGVALSGGGGGVSVGGSGAGGNTASTVDVTSYHNIVTTGERSAGIMAQSIGGGGGNGGFSIGLGGGSQFGGAVSVGGTGAGGAGAGSVYVRSFGTISTLGLESSGIVAQSIGGGGGNGGSSVAGSFSSGSAALGVAVGGNGAGGGPAGLEVVVNSYAEGANGRGVLTPMSPAFTTLSTHGDSSHGILAQSIGGGGGNGGFGGSLAVATGGFGVGFSVGGNGAGGGDAGAVFVSSVHNIVTEGLASHGILAQSIGGGGGNGGFALGFGGGSEFGGSAAIGGFGDTGGNASMVTASNSGTIWTKGDDSHGIAAQSIGGGGGNGGFSLSGSFSTGPVGLGIAVGGFGAGGGVAGSVAVIGSALGAGSQLPLPPGVATLVTDGDRSNGILAQSIGGGGGNGGFSLGGGFATGEVGIGVAVGGQGAGGGGAGSVQVISDHNILTDGKFSNGIVAQSLGGGGGNGGFSLGLGAATKFGGAVSIGGFATGGGGDASWVNVDARGTIITKGTDSHGIVAQAIGGSGGNGGAALSGSLATQTSGASVAIGGGGSNGGLGGAVTVNSNLGVVLGKQLSIETLGTGHGIFAQSIGGGGGSGGLAGSLALVGSSKVSISVAVGGFGGPGSAASTVDVTSQDNILTVGEGSMGIFAQSIGGGGGNGGMSFAGSLAIPEGNSLNVAASWGGSGGAGANAGIVTVSSLGNITTLGNFSDGVAAQSLGGGGGNGRLTIAGLINGCTTCTSSVPSITAAVGGMGGSGGAASNVFLTHVGSVATLGEESSGLRAQSIGGGGGNGGVAIAGSISGGSTKQFAGSVGGFGGPGSEAGDVFVTNIGSITTGSLTTQLLQVALPGEVFIPVEVKAGRASYGILAQSIGGGGGNGGLAISGAIGRVGETKDVNVGVSVGGFGGSGGLAGSVTVNNLGQITTFGHDAHGVFAQSIGGGGGNGGGSVTGLLAAGNPNTKAQAINLSVAVGGFGGSGNLGGAVTVNQFVGISTYGSGAHGIFAQSIGGGGGTGGNSNSVSLMMGSECNLEQGKLARKIINVCGKTEAEIKADKKKKEGTKIQVSVGGFGGIGNDGGIVTVANHGFINTSGDQSAGIKAQSIGGGGGSGGNGVEGTDGLFPGLVDVGVDKVLGLADKFLDTSGGLLSHLTLTLGGFGGASGDGGKVIVTNDGAITTLGFAAEGIFAQSIGGGGGDGGKSSSGKDGIASLGGFGGASGDGGSVTITNLGFGRILTLGNAAYAVFAQSIGGGGGNGGSSAGIIGVGGYGGASGDGGTVTVTNVGLIITTGEFSHGVVGQSIGGGGGQQTGGGGSVSKSKIAIGGAGGAFGAGGAVTINNLGSITTNAYGSDAIRAQSIGGGGGGAGDNSGGQGGNATGMIVSMGGTAGAGGNGGTVSVTNSNSLVTFGDKADGIVAQSIGGGGGDSGRAIGIIALGGSGGGSAGDGGAVNVTNRGNGFIWTHGAQTNGIFAQSVGGGGGAAGGTLGVAVIPLPIEVASKIGGDVGTGGSGGAVTVDNFAGIRTDGASSQGIFAQSIGGGGGAGAMSASVLTFSNLPSQVGGSGIGGNGGAVLVTNHATGVIVTNGVSSTGIFAQSVGGGGGTAGIGASVLSINFSSGVTGPSILGGTGGVGGNGGLVTVVNEGGIIINGDDSVGILAQSVGGGGGTAKVFKVPDINTPVFNLPGFSFTLGGSAGANGNGGDINVTNTGSITINGNNAVGIFAQSVGGGGGLIAPGGGVSSLTAATSNVGNGGTVTVNNTAGAIIVTGSNSVALWLQSVGGGGGVVQGNASSTTGAGSDASVGAAGNTPATSGNAVQPAGAIYAGSAGGHGASGATTLNQTGHLMALGLNSNALVAQSHAEDGSGEINLNILNAAGVESIIAGGAGSGAGVFIMNGSKNRLNNAGFITTILGRDGLAIRAGSGDDRVFNTGRVVGSVDLAAGANDFTNLAGATFLTGKTVYLGAGGLLANSGLLTLGGLDFLFTTNLTGNLSQSAPGTFEIDLDLQKVQADRLNVTGNAALSGLLRLNLIDPLAGAFAAKPGTHDLVIVSTGSGVTRSALTFTAPNTAVATYSLVSPTANDLVLRHVVDFSPDGVARNGHSLGDVINAIQSAQPSTTFGPLAASTFYQSAQRSAESGLLAAAPLQRSGQPSPAFRSLAVSLFYQPNVTTLDTVYASLSGSATVGNVQLGLSASAGFLMVLDTQAAFWLGNQASGPNGFSAAADRALEVRGYTTRSRTKAPPRSLGSPQDWRLWITGYDGSGELPGDSLLGSVNSQQDGGGVIAGFDYQLSARTLIGGAFGRGSFDFTAPGAETAGQTTGNHVAFYGARRAETYYLAGNVAFSFFDNDMQRHVFVPGTSVPLPGGPQISSGEAFLSGSATSHGISGSAEAGYKRPFSIFEVTPYAGFQYTALLAQTYTEMAGGEPSSLGLTHSDRTIMSLPTYLGVQFKAEGDWGHDKLLTGWIRGAWKHELFPDRTTESAFNAAPGFSFVVHGAEPRIDTVRASAGVKQGFGKGFSLFAQMDADFAGSLRTYAGSAGIRIGW